MRQEAENLWNIKPKNNFSYAEYLFEQQVLSQNKIPSFLYYMYVKSIHAQKALNPYTSKAFIYGSNERTIQRMAFWIDSGILLNRTHLSSVFESIIAASSYENNVSLFRQLISAGYDTNITINGHGCTQGIIKRKSTVQYLPMTLLDFAMELYKGNEALSGTQAKEKLIYIMEIIRILIKAGAKSAYELHELNP